MGEPDLFDTRLERLLGGVCPYCEVRLLGRGLAMVPSLQPRNGQFVRALCPCCDGLYWTASGGRRGPALISKGCHNCEHVGDWKEDEREDRTRIEFRDERHWFSRTYRNEYGLPVQNQRKYNPFRGM